MKALAIDGGGIRGLIPALVLAEIEARTGRPIATMVGLTEATTRVLSPVYDLQARQALLLRSDSDDVSMVDAAHATSAAPTYFEPVRLGARTLVDGGVFAINPAVFAYVDAGGAARPCG